MEKVKRKRGFHHLSLVFLLISNLTNGLRLYQFLATKSAEANKSVKTELISKITNEKKD